LTELGQATSGHRELPSARLALLTAPFNAAPIWGTATFRLDFKELTLY